MSNQVDQRAAEVIGAQAGRIAALIEAVRALIESHPDPAAFKTTFLAEVASSPIALHEDPAAECLRGHREVVNYLTAAIPLVAGGGAAPSPFDARIQ